MVISSSLRGHTTSAVVTIIQSFISARGKLARAQLGIPAWISSLKETAYIKGLTAIEADERDLGSSRNRHYYFFVLSRQASVNTYLTASLVMANKFTLRACLHGGGGPQVSGVTHFGGVNRLSI